LEPGLPLKACKPKLQALRRKAIGPRINLFALLLLQYFACRSITQTPVTRQRPDWSPCQFAPQLGWANGGSRGAKPPWRGAVGGVPPQNQKKGRVVHISNAAPSGAQNAGAPEAHGGGQRGGPGGASPLAGGVGDVPPQNQKKGRVARISNPAMSGTQNAGEPKAHGGGQTGGPGGAAPWRGVVGVCPSDLTP
jgi:hypothetical protein